MNETIGVYRRITVTDEFRELERLRSLARHNEASALHHAREIEREKWQGVVADKNAALADKDMMLAENERKLAKQAARIAELETRLTDTR